jgi:HEAT repeat protein
MDSMAKRNIEAAVDAVSALRDVSPEHAAPRLREGLADRVNLVAAKAAKITAELQLRQLIPDLLGAFDRLFVKPVERDPQCWAKNAIAQTLVDLDYREHAPFLMGARHVQLEAVWNGQEDTAQTLRGICLLALVSCNDLPRAEVFRVLVDAMADKAQVVRVEAVRAVAEMEGEEASLLLRLKARMGDKEPAVTGQVFDSLLRLEPARALPLVKGYLEGGPPELKEEAALALGTSRNAEAVDILLEALPHAVEPYFRKTVLRALGASRQQKAVAFLRSLVEAGGLDLPGAKEALALYERK